MRQFRVGLAQINTTVGDFSGNIERILSYIDEARLLGVDLLAFPELAICGYPPEDLLLKPQFVEENLRSLDMVVACSNGITVVVGFVNAEDDIYNAAAIVHDGRLAGVYHKIYLPNYGVFDENRYFQAGRKCPVYVINGIGFGVNICEDIWYEAGPTTVQAYSGAHVIVNISSSPYHFGKEDFRMKMLATRAADSVSIVAYVNLVGGQDELVFDGDSMVLNERGQLIARGKQFKEHLVVVDLDIEGVLRARLRDPRWRKRMLGMWEEQRRSEKIVMSESLSSLPKPPLPETQVERRGFPAEVYDALVLGTRDYVQKNGFKGVFIGLSGGIDSSLVATIAADALGASNVTGVAMPSRFSSPGSLADAALLSRNLGIRLLNISIESAFQAYLDTLADVFQRTKPDATEENIQARIRGTLLMALSNKFGGLVLTTGNKSEYATGYTTLYGDMAGGFAVIKDVPKTLVYQLARYRNTLAGMELIPDSVLNKDPSAELRADQRDTDSLPPYDQLDPVLTAYVEEDKSIGQIIAAGISPEMVKRVVQMVDKSEYKRRQSPPGVKITPKAFGRDRRLPITSRFEG